MKIELHINLDELQDVSQKQLLLEIKRCTAHVIRISLVNESVT
jgi:hypothetical protein